MSELPGVALTTPPPVLVKLLEHPDRRAILRALMEDDRPPRSPVDLTGLLGLPFSTVIYHVRVLAQDDALKLAATEETRRTLKHFYIPGELVTKNLGFVVPTLAADDDHSA